MDTAPGTDHAATDPRKMVITFLVLVFIFSGVFWYLTMKTPQVAENAGYVREILSGARGTSR